MSSGRFGSGSIERKRKWGAWQGDLDQFKRLARLFEELCAERRAIVFSSYDDDLDAPSTESTSSGTDQAVKSAPSIVRLSVRERQGEYSGGLEDMLEQFDRRTALGVELESDFGPREYMSLELGGDTRLPELALRVRSEDSAAGRAAFARLSDEIERGVPWWARGPALLRFILSFAVLASVLLIATGLRVQPDGALGFEWTGSQYLPIIPAVMMFAIMPMIGSPIYYFFPKFEVTGDGVSTASRRLLGLLGLLITIPIGVFVNYIS